MGVQKKKKKKKKKKTLGVNPPFFFFWPTKAIQFTEKGGDEGCGIGRRRGGGWLLAATALAVGNGGGPAHKQAKPCAPAGVPPKLLTPAPRHAATREPDRGPRATFAIFSSVRKQQNKTHTRAHHIRLQHVVLSLPGPWMKGDSAAFSASSHGSLVSTV